jgi:hypothetical protein
MRRGLRRPRRLRATHGKILPIKKEPQPGSSSQDQLKIQDNVEEALQPEKSVGNHSEAPDDKTQQLKKGFMNPLLVLKEMTRYPISVLAMQATHGGCWSGSRVVPDGSTSDSDFDFYQPFHPKAIDDVMHVLSFSRIRWNSILSEKVDEVASHRMTMVPYDTIWSLVEAMSPQASEPLDRLLEYLQDYFEDSDIASETLSDFLSRFDSAVQECRKGVGQKGWYDIQGIQKIWIYEGEQTRICDIPGKVQHTITALCDILVPCHRYFLQGSRLYKELILDGVNIHFRCEDGKDDAIEKIGVEDVRRDWETTGLPLHYMRTIVAHRIHQVAPWIFKSERDFLYSHLFDSAPKPCPISEESKGEPQGESYGTSFRILRGTLPDGKKIQVMLLPLRTTPMKTVLNFYGTPPMCIVSGTLGAHLYYDTAKEQIGELFDFRDDTRHPEAVNAIKKWEGRRWTFRDVSSEYTKRVALDEHVKLTEYENIYTDALEKMNRKDLELPAWWKRFFQDRKYSFQSYRWYHVERKIAKVVSDDDDYRFYQSQDLLRWVQNELDGHDEVIPKAEWDKRNSAKIALDIWFGGIKINPRWYKPLHQSWGTCVWHNRSWCHEQATTDQYCLP